jgi:iron complex transport system substrate-binding protein
MHNSPSYLFLAIVVFLVAGCSTPLQPSDANPQPRLNQVAIVDRLGRTVQFDAVPTRIVSLSPATTELLFALGLGSSIVGRTDYCDFPTEALKIPSVGSGPLEGINREAILRLQPDLVLCKSDSHEPLIKTFGSLNIPILALGSERFRELCDETTLIASFTHREKEAEQMVDQWKVRLEVIKRAVATIGTTERPRVFYQVWDEPLMTAGPDSFIGELLEIAGLHNIFSDLANRYTRVSTEVVLERDPEVILAPASHSSEVTLESFVRRPGWQEISAVRNHRIHLIDGDRVSRCGPRVLDALEEMIRAVYPELSPQLASLSEPERDR